MSASISLQLLDRSPQIFYIQIPVAVARSSSVGVALRYVLPVLWMTSRLAIVGHMASGVVIPGRSLMSMNALFCVDLWVCTFVPLCRCVLAVDVSCAVCDSVTVSVGKVTGVAGNTV